MAFFTFLGKDPDGNELPRVAVTVWDNSGEQLLLQTAVYGPYFPGEPTRVVQLPAGTYKAMALADGWLFAYPLTITIPEEQGLTVSTFIVVDVNASAHSGAQTATLPAIVSGYAKAHTPSANLSLLGVGFGSQSRGPGGFAPVTPNPVVFAKVLTSGDTPTLMTGPSQAVAIDLNGYFEVPLEPLTLYRVKVPGIHGFPFIRTGAAGTRANVDTLIETTEQLHAFEVIRP
jgi:hypothetical protein